MTRKKYLSSTVYTEQLKQQGIGWKAVNYPKEVVVRVYRSTPHAIVRDSNTQEDVGIVLYNQRNGLPYSEFQETVDYLFLKMGNTRCCSSPRSIN